jgi:hypothetical protein
MSGSSRRQNAPARHLVERRCVVCEWKGEVVETAGEATECPWCHAPTEPVRILSSPIATANDARNPHAAALGRLGGLKGGRARADALTAARRRQIARKAARARWKRDR